MGVWPSQYFQEPNPKKKIKEIWDDIDGYTFEEMYCQEDHYDAIDFVIPLPPLDYKGKQTKGIFFSQACELLLAKFPDLRKIFFSCANTMFSSYSRCETADVYFACYTNKKRERYHKKKYPRKRDIVFVPLQDADFTNEYSMVPTFNTPKTIDVICVSTAYPVKNLPIIAKALKAYEEKYGTVLKCTFAIGSRDAVKLENGRMDYENVRWDAKEELQKVDDILGNTEKYIDFIPYIEWYDLPRYYTSAKCGVLASLMEGKNRFINEVTSCDTPIIVFKDFNKFARGGYPVFFGNSGEYVPEFSPESLADTIHKVISNQDKYEPRKNYLIYNGRKNFVNTITDALPYFKKNIPGYKKGDIHNNLWVDLACQQDYQINYIDFLYNKNPAVMHVRGLKNIESLIKFYYSRFGIRG